MCAVRFIDFPATFYTNIVYRYTILLHFLLIDNICKTYKKVKQPYLKGKTILPYLKGKTTITKRETIIPYIKGPFKNIKQPYLKGITQTGQDFCSPVCSHSLPWLFSTPRFSSESGENTQIHFHKNTNTQIHSLPWLFSII